MVAQWKKMGDVEAGLAKMWYEQDGKSPGEIAELLHRNKSTVTRRLCLGNPIVKQGRRAVLTEAQVDKLQKKLEEMIKKASNKYEVTVTMLRNATGTTASVSTISKALHQRNIFFRPFREKPDLTPDEIKKRRAFAEKYHCKTSAWWNSYVHMHIDVKHFRVYLNGKARTHAAQEGSRGAYRMLGQGLDEPYVKSSKALKYNPGARGVKVLAGVGNGKVMLWEYIDKRNWSGSVAAEMYEGPLLRALRRNYPQRRGAWRVLEDNDPSGFKSSKGKAAKQRAGVASFDIPRKSPDLNICDYALWTEISKRMRRQEKSWPDGKKEKRDEYLARLRKTALGLPSSFVTRSIGDMARRCQRLRQAKGGHFEEGGQ